MADSITNIVRSRVEEQWRPAGRLLRHAKGVVRDALPNGQGANGATNDDALTFTVLSGRHAGASAKSLGRSVVVGSDFAADIIVTDPGVAARHIQVMPGSGRLLDRLKIKVLEAEVMVAGESLQPGATIDAYLPVRITLGDATLQISGRSKKSTASVLPILGLVAAAIIGGSTLAFLWDTASKTITAPPIPGRAIAAETPPDQAALDTIARRVKEAGLDGSVRLAPRGSAIVAEGLLPPDKHVKWMEVRRGLAAELSEPAALHDLVKISAVAEPSRDIIAGISLNRNPYVMTPDGRKVRVGEILDRGWIVRDIKEEGVDVERGTVRATIVPCREAC